MVNTLKKLIEEAVQNILYEISDKPSRLFHTTSVNALLKILEQGTLKANPFVSFSDSPYVGDISGNDVTIVFKPVFDVEKVNYSEDWFKLHSDQSSYVAGDGWLEQFFIDDYVSSDDIDLETGEINPDVEERAYQEGELNSFLAKDRENEWISKIENQDLSFNPQTDVDEIIVHNRSIKAALLQILGPYGIRLRLE